MPDDLYDHDVLAWSRHQAKLLRRVACGERVNDVDWDHAQGALLAGQPIGRTLAGGN